MKKLNRKGSAIITAIGMGIVLLIIIAAVFSFSRYRTQTVIQESKKVKALALAEAGLEVALGELFNNSTFQTHTVKINGEELEWDTAQTRECSLEGNQNHNFEEDSGNSGTLSGTLGDGKFKVRVGTIPYQDNDKTKAIDESKAYLRVESMGIYDKTVRRIIAVVNRRFPAREFLMYDGGILSVVYGQTGDSGNTNVFSIGHLYGHEGVEISQILNKSHGSASPGTKQKIFNIDAILSGNGGIFFYSDVDATFFHKNGTEGFNGTIPRNYTFPSGGKYPKGEEAYGEMPEEMQNLTPEIPENIKAWVKDKNSGISIPPRAPSFDDYKKQAQNGGAYYSSGNTQYKVTPGFGGPLNAVYLDFGSGGSKIREGNVNNFPSNGVFYSDKDIVIKGNPPKDVSIVSEKNIFVAGDFNQNCSGEGKERYCYPQDWKGKNPLLAEDYDDYYKEDFKKDTEANGSFKYHVAATIVAKERVVFDHRSPVDCCENELYPFLKYELAKAISDQPNEDEAKKVLSPNGNPNIVASDSIDGFKANIATFTDKFKISDSSLTTDMENVYNNNSNGGKFNDAALEELTKVTWKAFKNQYTGGEDYTGNAAISNEKECAVDLLLFKLRAKMCNDNIDTDTVKEFFEPTHDPQSIKDNPGDYLFYPEMTTNGMFISCGKQNNTFYSGPDVDKYFNEIGYSQSTGGGISNKWYASPEGLLHRTFGTETNLRLYDVKRIPVSENTYYPPTRKKVYDDTLLKLDDKDYSGNNLELSGFVVLSWQDLGATEEEFEKF